MMIRRFHGREPELSDFINFVDATTLLASDPLSSQEALKEYNKSQENGTRRKLKSYFSHAAEPVKNERDVSSENNYPVCEGRHDLNNYRQFNDLKLEERCKTLKDKKLCYGCYSLITSEHNTKSCKNEERSIRFGTSTIQQGSMTISTRKKMVP